jgi:hypothetical protein
VIIETVKELIKPIGRPGYAYDFPLETGELKPEDLKGLIDREVWLQTSGGQFDFCNRVYEGDVEVTDVSDTTLHVRARKKGSYNREPVAVKISQVQLIEWTEKITKRVVVQAGARVR